MMLWIGFPTLSYLSDLLWHAVIQYCTSHPAPVAGAVWVLAYNTVGVAACRIKRVQMDRHLVLDCGIQYSVVSTRVRTQNYGP